MFALPARRVVASALAVAALALFAATAASAQSWTNPNQPALTRANELLSALSTDQQIQLALGNFAALQSFGVPNLTFDDGPDGIRNPGTTAMPSGQSIAATFNRALAYAYGQVVGSEARGEGFGEWTGPAVDIDRTPLAGRQPEAEGEDPFLSGNTAAQIVAGAKSQHVIVTLKHYTAYNQDYGRIGFDSIGSPATDVMVSERALQEIYEEPFRIAVQQGGLDSVMCSYNQINGLPSCQNPTTLGDLENGMGFNGFVAPDFGFAVRDPVAAANAGTDLPALPGGGAGGLTAADFTSGAIPMSRLQDIDRRILFAIFDSGLYDNPLPATPSTEVSTPEHQQVATDVAEAGMVLLKNDRHVLPLSSRDRKIALIGPAGEDAVFVTGGSAGVPLASGQAITPRARHHRPGESGRRQCHDLAGVGRRRGLPHAGSVLGPHAEQRNRVRAPRQLLEQLRLNRRAGGHRGRSDRRSHEPAGRDRSDVVGTLDRHADPDRDRSVPLHDQRGGARHAQDRGADVRAGVPRSDAVHRRSELRAPGNGQAHRRHSGAGRDRLLEPVRAVQPRDPLRLADAVAVANPCGGGGRPQG